MHTVKHCTECGASLKNVSPERYIVRQIIDVPDIKVKIVEHRAEVKICPHCKRGTSIDLCKQIYGCSFLCMYSLH
ncbi:IS66 family transposase zinc-finger binding domain-containing protein [Clostridium sp. KNHs214]|uniref:IS66 family transposase zinc-finger binding domain-containing protein n=1 Tax=Clostridium sp. KNHs214 TaxID=1540257 RepID=UPI00241D6687|nr:MULTISPECIES: IS66 family transposase zinc-finger binding domain-containing protein [Clostridiaceae]